MTKVLCARIECKHNKKNVCKLKYINLRAWNIHTVNEGFKRMEECRNFEVSEEYLKIEQELIKIRGVNK